MQKIIRVAAIALLALMTSCASPPVRESPRVASPDTNLGGTWIVSRAEFAGNSLSVPLGMELQISGDQYRIGSVTNAALLSDRGRIVLLANAPDAQAAHIDIIGEDGPSQGKRFPAIYRLNARELEMCIDLAEQARPTEFASREGTLLVRVTYTRK